MKALDKVINYIAMIINENYNSNIYCCMITLHYIYIVI